MWLQKFRKKFFFQSGHRLLLWCLFLIVSAFLLNILVQTLPVKQMKWDFSQNHLYTLTPQTEEVLAHLKTDVQMYQIARPGNENQIISNLLDQYAGSSHHISRQMIDPLTEPTVIQLFTQGEIQENSVIVKSDKYVRIVEIQDMMQIVYDSDTGHQLEVFDGEAYVTAAIRRVTGETTPTVYLLNGHRDVQLSDSFLELLEKEQIRVQPLLLSAVDRVPQDASVILASEEGDDLAPYERQIMEEYLKRGGNVLLLTDHAGEKAYQNWETLAADYGLRRLSGVVTEQEPGRYLPGYPTFLVPILQEHPLSAELLLTDYSYLIGVAQALQCSENPYLPAASFPLLMTGNQAYLRIDDMAVSEQRAFCLAAGSERENGSRFIWITSGSMLNSYLDSQVSGGNSAFLLYCLKWLTGREEERVIPAKTIYTSNVACEAEGLLFWGGMLIVILPVGILLAGALFCRARKNSRKYKK